MIEVPHRPNVATSEEGRCPVKRGRRVVWGSPALLALMNPAASVVLAVASYQGRPQSNTSKRRIQSTRRERDRSDCIVVGFHGLLGAVETGAWVRRVPDAWCLFSAGSKKQWPTLCMSLQHNIHAWHRELSDFDETRTAENKEWPQPHGPEPMSMSSRKYRVKNGFPNAKRPTLHGEHLIQPHSKSPVHISRMMTAFLVVPNLSHCVHGCSLYHCGLGSLQEPEMSPGGWRVG